MKKISFFVHQKLFEQLNKKGNEFRASGMSFSQVMRSIIEKEMMNNKKIESEEKENEKNINYPGNY